MIGYVLFFVFFHVYALLDQQQFNGLLVPALAIGLLSSAQYRSKNAKTVPVLLDHNQSAISY